VSTSSTYGPVRVVELLPARSSTSANEPMHSRCPLAAPDRQRRAPVALARERPVDVVLQPLAEAPVLDVLRVPVDVSLAASRRRASATCGCTRTAWRSRAAACRSASSAGRRAGRRSGAQQAPRAAQVLDQVRVGVLDPAAGVGPIRSS
jgi:hypothetical protein